MITFPNAKINLGLNIVSKREDGFHNLETCFVPVGWSDALEIIESQDKTTFTSGGIAIPDVSSNNLCLKAYELLEADFNLPPVNIHLQKNIPIGAGLGGGSADASFTLKMLNEKFALSLSDVQLIEYANQLGSDCAFFILNKPCLAYGRGTELEPIQLDLSGYCITIINPGVHVSTKDAYANVKPATPKTPLSEIIQQPINNWKDGLVNDFEKSVFLKFPELKKIKLKLYDLGAIYATMSGSGSSLVGIFDNQIDIKSHFDSSFQIWSA